MLKTLVILFMIVPTGHSSAINTIKFEGPDAMAQCEQTRVMLIAKTSDWWKDISPDNIFCWEVK